MQIYFIIVLINPNRDYTNTPSTTPFIEKSRLVKAIFLFQYKRWNRKV